MVLVISGKNRTRKGKILSVFPRTGKVLVEGVQLRKKHVRPRKAGQKGEIVSLPTPIDSSNIKLVCPKCARPARVGFASRGGGKIRVCKKCAGEF